MAIVDTFMTLANHNSGCSLTSLCMYIYVCMFVCVQKNINIRSEPQGI